MESIDMGLLRGAIVVVSLATFLGICWWAYRPAHRDRFENDGWLAFDPDESDEPVLMRVPVQTSEEGRKER